ncbi:caspase family protein, partial [bacterium]
MKKFLFSAFLALASLAAQAETYALMVGISDYPDVLDASGKIAKDEKGSVLSNDLNGCVNDIKSYESILMAKYEVKKDNIKTILDKDANEAGFVKGMEWLLSTAKPGDQVLFFYSGHGTQYKSTKEEDGTEEAIVLADMTLVQGDLFNKIAQALSKAGMHAAFVFDSCYSGGMSRDEATKPFRGTSALVRKRFLSPNDLKAMPKSHEFAAAKEAALNGMAKKKAAQGGSYAFVMAGNDKQTTADLTFKDPSKPAHGLFSLIFIEVLEKFPTLPIGNAVKQIEQVITEN